MRIVVHSAHELKNVTIVMRLVIGSLSVHRSLEMRQKAATHVVRLGILQETAQKLSNLAIKTFSEIVNFF